MADALNRLAASDILRQAADTLELPASPNQIATLVEYLALLHRWNATYNLTAVRDPNQMVTQHLVDCMAAVPLVRRLLAASQQSLAGINTTVPAGASLLDVGSGGGLPGIVFASLLPDANVTCIDSVGKKVAFVAQASIELRLSNLHAIRARVESLPRIGFDLIVSRAFASLHDFIALTRSQLNSGGVWVAMKGKLPVDEIDELSNLPSAPKVFHVEQLQVPGMSAERCAVCIQLASHADLQPMADLYNLSARPAQLR